MQTKKTDEQIICELRGEVARCDEVSRRLAGTAWRPHYWWFCEVCGGAGVEETPVRDGYFAGLGTCYWCLEEERRQALEAEMPAPH